jgi:hypothetical protein
MASQYAVERVGLLALASAPDYEIGIVLGDEVGIRQ